MWVMRTFDMLAYSARCCPVTIMLPIKVQSSLLSLRKLIAELSALVT